ncbi:Protein O-linked-mannose beta-1,4-N-acetylglucosaminyltransferase 2 [Holothuria leucospilota]|uniref:Protein O-linked-mannose beta-1,4-N-acetylglucosaminyltransferase 2 n=1 Tax=Holothuria leucospilota TaxID=206669 RepID=A0A9Q0YJ83_HOLLE|nr:Protein O-linked-mannose beta-1,4-N-acetylglucosaminyltransferase 2 [Holothuria leucospilota]
MTPRCSGDVYGILFSRKINRKILNEKELKDAIAGKFDIKMVELSVEANRLPYIIKTVSCAKLVVGVHGSMQMLGVFLPPS